MASDESQSGGASLGNVKLRRPVRLAAVAGLLLVGAWAAGVRGRDAGSESRAVTVHVPPGFAGYAWDSNTSLYLSRFDRANPTSPGRRGTWTYVTHDIATGMESPSRGVRDTPDLRVRFGFAGHGYRRITTRSAGPTSCVLQ